jgi:hypothetical protein
MQISSWMGGPVRAGSDLFPSQVDLLSDLQLPLK